MDVDVKSVIGRMIQAAQVADGNDTTRSDLHDQYMGEPYGDEVKGRSTWISSDISDCVEGLLPDLVDVFTSAENIVEFRPVGPEDEEAAKQETEVCNHIFWQQNAGFLNIYTAFKEALIQQNAYFEAGWQEQERIEIEEYEGLTLDELQGILGEIQGEYEVVSATGIDVQTGQPQVTGSDPQTGQPQFAPIDIKLRITTREKRYVIDAFPQEEFFLTPRWHSLDLDGIPCCGRRQEIEVGELRRMGFSEDSIAKASDDSEEWSLTDEARFDTEFHFDGGTDEEEDESTKKVTVFKAYVRADHNGDGRAELLKVWAIGDGSTLLQWENGEDAIEEVSGLPFAAITPFIMPHRHTGRSLAELVADLQKAKTVIWRQSFDNIYRNNNARPQYDETLAGPNLARDLAMPEAGAPVRTGGTMVEWIKPPSVLDSTLPLISALDDVREMRTGSTRYNQGLDAESLNKTATGMSMIFDAMAKKRQLIARTFAETGLATLFRIIHRDLRSGPVRQLAMRIRNEWIDVNPRTWKHRTDLTISVGMGSGDRDQKREFLMLMKQAQSELMASGSPMVDAEKLFNTAEKLAGTYGVEDIAPYLNDPASMPPPEPKPDPQEQYMQAQMQAMQADMQIKQVEAQIKQQELQMKQQEMQARQVEAQMKQQETGARIANERQKLEMEHQRKLRELEIKHEAERRQVMAANANRHTDEQRLALDRDRAIMDDDFKRDKLEIDAATGFYRDVVRDVNSAPPMEYRQVGR